jgi:hypothetical protein
LSMVPKMAIPVTMKKIDATVFVFWSIRYA